MPLRSIPLHLLIEQEHRPPAVRVVGVYRRDRGVAVEERDRKGTLCIMVRFRHDESFGD